MNAQFQTSLSTLESRFNALLTSLTISPTAAGAPAAALSLLDADDALTTAIDTLRRHQENYTRILQLRAEAEALETKVKSIVREVVRYEKEIRTVCDDDHSDSGSDSEQHDDTSALPDGPSSTLRHTKEVDYKLLLDFARRISKYNHQAAADATRASTDPVVDNGADVEPVAAVTRDATSWLDESARATRQAYMLPYPAEERIRLGLMGQIQLAAAEGRPGFDAEGEVERLIREAEGCGVADGVAPGQVGEEVRHAGEAARAAAQAGSTASNAAAAGGGVAPAKPKAMLDLDLYDPDDDE